MAQYSHTEKLAAPADKTWAVIRRFTDGSWMGLDMTTEGEGVGATRRIEMGGAAFVEKCERLDDTARILGYTIVEGPVPFSNYHSTMEVAEDGEGSSFTWSATFDPIGDAADAEKAVKAMYTGGAQSLKRYVEG